MPRGSGLQHSVCSAAVTDLHSFSSHVQFDQDNQQVSTLHTCGRRCQMGGEASPGLSSRSACVLWRRSGEASADQWPIGGSLDADASAPVPGAAAWKPSCEMLPLEPHLRAAQSAGRRIQEWTLAEHFCV